jgi:hypothetical protein
VACYLPSKHSKQFADTDASYVFKNKANCIEQALVDFGYFAEKKSEVLKSVIVVRARKTEDGPDESLSDLAPCFDSITPLQITLASNLFAAKQKLDKFSLLLETIFLSKRSLREIYSAHPHAYEKIPGLTETDLK